MNILEKIKKKILNNSNSYKYYEREYFHLLKNEKDYLLKIKTLEDELNDKNDEIKFSNYYNNINDLFLQLNTVINKLDVLSRETSKINNNLGNVDKLSMNLQKFQEDYFVIKNKLNNFLDLSFENYIEQRKYFFNGYEDLIKSYMDTDFLFNICYFNGIEFLSFSPEENRILLKSKDDIIFTTNNHFWTFMEVYGLNEYSIPQLYSFEDFVVFDIGMNRAYATLNFANYENCSAVYGFEIDKSTYDVALKNINLNPKIKYKIFPYNMGLSDSDEFVDLYYIDGFDGLNTIIPEFTDVQYSLKSNKDILKTKTVEVKKASKVINEILKKVNLNSKIVLKIDTEGAEYKIISDLIDSGLILNFDVILGEGHVFSNDDFWEKLLNLGFKVVKRSNSSSTYSFALVKREYYEFWEIIK